MATESRFIPSGPTTAEQTFPVLSGAQMERMARHGKRRSIDVGEVLVKAGEPLAQFYIVVSGRIEVFRKSPVGDEYVLAVTTGQFSGEVSLLSGRRALITAVV